MSTFGPQLYFARWTSYISYIWWKSSICKKAKNKLKGFSSNIGQIFIVIALMTPAFGILLMSWSKYYVIALISLKFDTDNFSS